MRLFTLKLGRSAPYLGLMYAQLAAGVERASDWPVLERRGRRSNPCLLSLFLTMIALTSWPSRFAVGIVRLSWAVPWL